MFTDLHWLATDGKVQIAIAARPRSGEWLEDEIRHWAKCGVRRVVSLLEPHEIEELGLHDEPRHCADTGIAFQSFPIADRNVPADPVAARRVAEELGRSEGPVAIHCRAGIGRSSVMAAAVLISLGVEPADALARIARARGLPVPDTEAQRDWVMGLLESG